MRDVDIELMFAQNFQRDKPGTWKKPWPSYFINDRGQNDFAYFDFADPLLPNDWWCFIRGGHVFWLYPLYPICLVFMVIAIFGSRSHQEQNQIICELSFYPDWLFIFYLKYGGWKSNRNNYEYWSSRGEIEYSDAISEYVKDRLLK